MNKMIKVVDKPDPNFFTSMDFYYTIHWNVEMTHPKLEATRAHVCDSINIWFDRHFNKLGKKAIRSNGPALIYSWSLTCASTNRFRFTVPDFYDKLKPEHYQDITRQLKLIQGLFAEYNKILNYPIRQLKLECRFDRHPACYDDLAEFGETLIRLPGRRHPPP